MTGPIDPIRPIRLIGRRPKPAEQAPAPDPAPVVNLTINVGQPQKPGRLQGEPPASAEAHMIAQGARVRGLRGGQKVLDTARSAYLEAQWSGPGDRRARTGRITKTTI